MNFKGIIIEESLKNNSIFKELIIIKTTSESVTKSHKTPWLNKWTIHQVEIPEENSDYFFDKLSKSLDNSHEWYIEVENNKFNVLIFHDRIIKKRIFKYF